MGGGVADSEYPIRSLIKYKFGPHNLKNKMREINLDSKSGPRVALGHVDSEYRLRFRHLAQLLKPSQFLEMLSPKLGSDQKSDGKFEISHSKMPYSDI